MESDPFKPTEAERGKAVLILQAAELALDGGAATVEVAAAVQSGTVTLYDAHCHTTQYGPGQAFVEVGDDALLVRNNTTSNAVLYVTLIVPKSATSLRIDKRNRQPARQAKTRSGRREQKVLLPSRPLRRGAFLNTRPRREIGRDLHADWCGIKPCSRRYLDAARCDVAATARGIQGEPRAAAQLVRAMLAGRRRGAGRTATGSRRRCCELSREATRSWRKNYAGFPLVMSARR